jgi:lipid A disaccharide synthetase
MTTDFSSFYCLLVVIPEEPECYETVHILNYFGFPLHIDEDNILKPAIKKEMGFKKDDPVRSLNNNKF